LFCPSSAFGRRLDLRERKPRVIEKNLAGRGEHNAARSPLQ